MRQSDRMNSANNPWEADPWDCDDPEADRQLAGFTVRACKEIRWLPVQVHHNCVFGIEASRLRDMEVEFIATCDDEELLLMKLAWHDFPDPPEWRLATRPANRPDGLWQSWGYFSALPENWSF